ncbi:hypothetical protein [Oxalicibacterium faecigallinarum]|uniref:hypothetical protein n=1 Tax=Oxalicibacterium faecigallinarum TaxID=573741 RepID=UPI001E517AC2|nr:hypothetical protein [Oxalicibacterium faecigallinarum]
MPHIAKPIWNHDRAVAAKSAASIKQAATPCVKRFTQDSPLENCMFALVCGSENMHSSAVDEKKALRRALLATYHFSV